MLSRSNLRGKYLFFFNSRSRTKLLPLAKKGRVWVLLIAGICYQLQKKPKRNFRIPFCVPFPFRLYGEHMDLCFRGASVGRFLFLNILRSQTPLLAALLSHRTFYLSQTKALENIYPPFPAGRSKHVGRRLCAVMEIINQNFCPWRRAVCPRKMWQETLRTIGSRLQIWTQD